MNEEEEKIILNAIKIAFLEIRTSKNLAGAQMLADIFHKVPSQLISDRTFEEIEKEILLKAKNFGVEGTIRNWLN